MKDEELPKKDTSAKPVDTSTPNRLEFVVNGKKMYLDLDDFNAYWEWRNKIEGRSYEQNS